jgi:hypothetical protein
MFEFAFFYCQNKGEEQPQMLVGEILFRKRRAEFSLLFLFL